MRDSTALENRSSAVIHDSWPAMSDQRTNSALWRFLRTILRATLGFGRGHAFPSAQPDMPGWQSCRQEITTRPSHASRMWKAP